MTLQATLLSTIAVVLLSLCPLAHGQPAGLQACTWLFSAFEGIPLSASLSPNFNNSDAVCPGLMSFSVSPNQDPSSAIAGSSFAFDNLRRPNFTITPPIGQNNYQIAVNIIVRCQVVRLWCNPGVVFFWVRPSGLTPAPTAVPSTAVPTPQPTAVPSTAIPTPLPAGATPVPTTASPSAAPSTAVPTAVPVPQLPVTCPSPLPPAYSYISQPVRVDILSGVQNCVGPSLAVVQDPLNPAIGLWSVNSTDNNTLYFDATGVNTLQAVFSVSVNVNCGGVTYCIVSQQIIVSAPLTPAPAPILADCPQAYGFQTFFGQTQSFSLSTQDFAYQCSDNTTFATYAAASTTLFGALSALDPTSGNFTYVAPNNVTLDSFRFVISCNGLPACGGQAFLVTNMNAPTATPAPPTAVPGIPTTSAMPSPTPVPLGTSNPLQQWPLCPGASPFIFPFFRNADQSLSTQSANLFTGGANLTYPCTAYGNVTLLSNPVVGQLLGFDAVSGQFWYASSSPVNGWDNFTFGLSCISPSPFTCVATAMIIVFPPSSGNTTAPTPMPTIPQPFVSINQGTIQCRGTCDSDAWKSLDLYPAMFDTTPDFNGGFSQITPRKDGMTVGTAQYSLSQTQDNVVVLAFFTKIGNMAARFPTFFPFDVPDRNPFTADAVVGSGAAFNATCLNLQTSYGVAYGMWQWDSPQLLNLSGRIVNNSLYNRGNDYFQKFGGKHKSCDTFLSNSCQFAPMLTPNIPGQQMSSDKLSGYINWTLTVDDCDATWWGTLSLDNINSMTYADGSHVFQPTGPKQVTGLLYSEVVKPRRWLRGSSGTISSSNPINVSILIRTYLIASARQVDSVSNPNVLTTSPATVAPSAAAPANNSGTLPPLSNAGSGSGAGTGSGFISTSAGTTAAPQNTAGLTSTPLSNPGSGSGTGTGSGFNSTSAGTTAAPQNTAPITSPGPQATTAGSTAAPQGNPSGSQSAAATTTIASTFLPSPPALSTAAPNATQVSAAVLPLVNVSVDIEYNIDVNPLTGERIYLYNVLLYPVAGQANFSLGNSGLYVSNVQLVSASFTSPAASQCPQCTGTISSCLGAGTGFADQCGAAALVTFAPTSLQGVSWCPNASAPPVQVPGIAPPRTCPQTFFNVSFVGTVSGAMSSLSAGQPGGLIVINVTLSNGQVFSVVIQQRAYISQASSSPDLGVTVNRPTTYYTVADPLGSSLSTAPWKIPKPDPAPDFNFRTAASSMPAGSCPATFVQPFIDFAKAAPFRGASMTEQPDARVFGPSDWVFLQLNTKKFANATLNFMTLTVDAAEVIPRPTQQQFAFLLTGSNPPAATQSMGGVYLDWATYASFLSFRAVDTMSGTRPMQFAFVPGQLLRSGCSQTVVFRVEAAVSVGAVSYFIRLLIPVSQSAQRAGPSLKSQYYGDLAASLAQSLASTGSTPNYAVYIAIVGVLLILTFLVAAYLDPSLMPSVKLQAQIFLGALHIIDMPLKPEPPTSPGKRLQQQQTTSHRSESNPAMKAAADSGGRKAGAAPPSLSIVTSSSTSGRPHPVSSAAGGAAKKFGVIETETLPSRHLHREELEGEMLPRKDDEERILTPKASK
jgi:hypothetical protein